MGTVKSLKYRKWWAQEAATAKGLNGCARALLDRIAFRAGKEGHAYGRSQAAWAEEIGFSERSVRTAFKTLQEKGLVHVYR